MGVRITNIQHFSLHDGSGIRTTVFLKGCNLTCPWCCNPENMNYSFEEYTVNNSKKKFGCDISLNDLEKEILKDEVFYSQNEGGVTFSGGEPLLQIKNLEPLLKRLKDRNINICFESALQVPSELVILAVKYSNQIYIDIKILNHDLNKIILNGDLDMYYNNIELIAKSNINDITFRIPLNEEYTFKKDNIEEIINLIKKYPSFKIELFKTHNLAESKYNYLNKNFMESVEVNDEKLRIFIEKLKKINDNVNLIKL